MTLNVSTWSIRNPVAVVLCFVLLTVAGAGGFLAMKVQDFPDIDFPIVTVTAELPGASPPQIESDVARKIEDALANLPGIRHIGSTLADGTATITAEFMLDKPVQEALDDVRDAVSSTRSDLPADLRDPVISRRTLAGAPVMTYTIASTRLDQEALSWFVDNEVRRRLLAVPGIGAVARVGGVEREVRVELAPDPLLALNATAADISRQLAGLHQEASGGRVEMGGGEQSVRTIATVATARDIAALDIALGDGRRIRLDQVATVSDTTAAPRSMALFDGKAAVGFDIMRARGAGEIEVAAAARAAIELLKAAHPDIAFTEAVDSTAPIVRNYRGSMTLLLEGAVLAVIVVFFFLRDRRATFIAAVALPLSAIPAFAAMHLMGFTLNTVSLLSLSLVIGVLVDDAIVEIENIERHLLMGKTPMQAAIDASGEIGLAVVATTFTLIAVFLPTSLMGGMVGKYFVQFGWTAAMAVFFSLVVARMLTPTMAAYMLKAPAKAPRAPRWIEAYVRCVRGCLRHRRLTMAAAGMLMLGGVAVALTLPGEFIPADDGDQTQVTLTLPPGGMLAETRVLAEAARGIVAGDPHVVSVYTAIGGGSGASEPDESPAPAAGVGTAVLTLNLVPRGERGGLDRNGSRTGCARPCRCCPGCASPWAWAGWATAIRLPWARRTAHCSPGTPRGWSATSGRSPGSAR